mmetsp:Transcript_4066/g.3008  ORF Transcript_4066/g.3008 Transcript_4066/m.3008 type:complete len:136 (-) Transcript_4066:39-446(-)
MERCGMKLQAGKGYHFAQGSYVEYIGNIDNQIKDKLKQDLQDTINKLIQDQKEDEGVFSGIVAYEEAQKLLKGGVPSYMPEGENLRVVKLMQDDGGCPCGGTHVKHVKDIVEVEIKKINKKGKNTQVGYAVKQLN